MRHVNVEVAAPHELSRKRELAWIAIEEANQTFHDEGLAIRLKSSSTEPEIVIGVFWWQFSIEAQERIQRGLEEWSEHGKPYTMVFFDQGAYSPTSSREALDWSKVLELREELSERGMAAGFFDDEDFVRKAGGWLKKLARQMAIDSGVVESPNFDSSRTSTPEVMPGAFTCQVVSSIKTVRAEGLTEVLSEIGLMFSGGVPVVQGGRVHSLRLELFLNTAVTNRIDEMGFSDAVLVRNDGFAGAREVRGQVTGNLLAFDKVAVEPPGPDESLSFSIKNIRANAAALSGGAGPCPPIVGVLNIRPESSVTVVSSIQDLALLQPALEFVVIKPDGAATGRKIPDVFVQSFSADGETLGLLRFTSLQPLAFMPRTAEGHGSVEDCRGTRLKVEMHNLPSGVRIFVSVANCGSREKARLIGSEFDEYRERGPTKTFDEIQVAEVAIENGRGNAVWEVIASDFRADEVMDFAAFLKYDAQPEKNSPPGGTGVVTGSFAPTLPPDHMSRAFGADVALPVPRFVGSYKAAQNWFTVEIQWTTLLFPFVSNQGGIDTSIIVSNVSADPLGAASNAGAIKLFFYGNNAPGVCYTTSVPAGQVYCTMASTMAQGFVGYVIARCAFSPARGFAIVSDLGMRAVATGYLAEVIDEGHNRVLRVQNASKARRVSWLEVDSTVAGLDD
jgi:hypothetical protein